LCIGTELFVISDASAWWLGDWLVYGQERFPDRYIRVVRETNLSYKTLRNYAWVARKFPVSRRRDTLALQHHAEVAALPEDEQEFWLDRAERAGWSVAELRRQLKAARSSAAQVADADSAERERVEIKVDPERKRRWQVAANATSGDLAEWACAVIDRAARAELEVGLPKASAG
jgi:hypothetical protein